MLDTRLKVETPEGVDLELTTAGPMSRFLAWILDLLLRLVVAALLSIPLALLGMFGTGMFLIIIFLLEWFYPVLFEVFFNGATVGKKALGLRVLNLDGTPVNWGASLVRNVMRAADILPFIYGFGLLAMLFSRRFQRLGDLAAGTIVVYTQRGLKPAHRPIDYPPLPPPVSLKLDEQRAVISFAQRLPFLSAARAQELAQIAARPLWQSPNGGLPDPTNYLCRIAAWLYKVQGTTLRAPR